ncbi:MAG: PqqD family protein [Bacteroidaceae bacterium]|nr:PqqD family protein [Bacteroidaceae bacterium]MBR3627048.1 PqqD family protein [Bacteroidaceae bacterium]
MKLRKGFALREICGERIVVPEGIDVINFNKLISLNGSAKYLWETLQDKEFTVQDVAKLLTDKYEVEEATALSDAEKLINKWQEIGLIEA